MTGVIGAFFERAAVSAQTAGRRFCGVDLTRAALEALRGDSNARILQALERLGKIDLSKLAVSETERRGKLATAFLSAEGAQDARARCEADLARLSVDPTRRGYLGRAASGILIWINETTVEDRVGGFAASREVLNNCGLPSPFLLEAEARRRAAFHTGRPMDAEGEILDADDLSGRRFLGRGPALATHVAALRRALSSGEHYLLVGPAGGGKTAFLRRLAEAALRAFARDEDPQLRNLRFCFYDRSDLVGSPETAEKAFASLSARIREGFTPVIDDLDLVMSPDLPSGEAAIRAIGHEFVAGRRGFLLSAEREAAHRLPFVNRLTPRSLPPATQTQSAEIAADHAAVYALRDQEIRLTEGADALGRRAQRLAKENYAALSAPRGALRILDGAVELAKNLGENALDEAALASFVARDLNTPREMIERDGDALFSMLLQQLQGEVIAQDAAVSRIAEAVAYGERTSAGDSPRARILMAGPPGVGKTYLARRLAEALGYDQDAFVMLNMSEYSAETARTRFIGADPGYVGFGHTRTLYDAVRARPSCVILLDEIDRAHPSIQDILLSILEGQGADASGRPVYFTQSVILATTNLGMEQIDADWRAAQARGATREEAQAAFDDRKLRGLILHGAVDETEREMQSVLDDRVLEARAGFSAARNPAEQDLRIAAYAEALRRRSALEMTRRHSPLDRAFLDRIDVVAPFFPIDQEADVARIVALETRRLGWSDCPEEVRRDIVAEVMAGGSVRAIKRLAKEKFVSTLRRAAPTGEEKKGE